MNGEAQIPLDYDITIINRFKPKIPLATSACPSPDGFQAQCARHRKSSGQFRDPAIKRLAHCTWVRPLPTGYE